MHCRLLGLSFLLFATGCGGSGLVAVSGKVTLDGKALPNAIVTFQPDKANPGPISEGKTDANGQYTLKSTTKDVQGAVVGKHKVSISASEGDPGEAAGANPKPRVERIPAKYNSQTTLTFDVPSGGTSKADFELTGK
jgi:hypothetical protein